MLRHLDPRLTLPALAVILVALTAPAGHASAAPASADALLGHVTSKAAGLVATDHARLSKHPAYKDILSFLASEKHAAGLVAANDLGFAPGTAVTRSIGFRFASGAEGSVMTGPGFDGAKLRAAAEKKLAAGFETGEHAGRTWFTVATGVRAAELAPGVIAFGPRSIIERTLDLAAGKGKAITKRSGYKALSKAARTGKPEVWGITWVPKKDRERLEQDGATDMAKVERISWQARGAGDIDFLVTAYTASAEDAEEVATGVKGKIQRKIVDNALLKAVGVAALAKRIEVTTSGKTASAKTKLSAAQVASLTRAAKTIVKVLR